MNQGTFRHAVLGLLVAAGNVACGGGAADGSDGSGPPPPPTPAAFVYDVPEGFPEPRAGAVPGISDAVVELGRHLFYDGRMAVNEAGSCVSCHVQSKAFTDGLAVSVGPTGEAHRRSAMSLANAVYNARQNWANPNIDDLRQQAIDVLFNEDPIEMGWSGHEGEILARLRGDAALAARFRAAWPDDTDPFTVDRVATSLAAFVSTLLSGQAARDRYYSLTRPEPDAMSVAARRGEALFFSERLECFHCHGGFNFATAVQHDGNTLDAAEFRNNGLYNIAGPAPGLPLASGNYPTRNQGLYEFTGNPDDMGRFRAPTLRNIVLTAPYMHDGSIASLREVLIDHYGRGGRVIAAGADAGDGSRSPYRDALMVGFTLSQDEIADVLAFLDSLTDWDFICDPRHADPFGRVPMHPRCTTR